MTKNFNDVFKKISSNNSLIEFSSDKLIKTLKYNAIETLISKVDSLEYLQNLLIAIDNLINKFNNDKNIMKII
jgi:hypothetical protein